jgi:hypothetical protein
MLFFSGWIVDSSMNIPDFVKKMKDSFSDFKRLKSEIEKKKIFNFYQFFIHAFESCSCFGCLGTPKEDSSEDVFFFFYYIIILILFNRVLIHLLY